uniref:MFS domain-containing protein n=1 Tax=Syphacia muris TaxID=451379 RepID=A0A0N5ANV7_9BILA
MADDIKADKMVEGIEKVTIEPKRKAAFDDLLKLGRYTKFLILLFYLLLTVQSLQLLFMSFGGAAPKVVDVKCDGARPTQITEESMKNVKQTCEAVEALRKQGKNCTITTKYKYGSVHRDFGLECNPNAVTYSSTYQNAGLVIGTAISGFFVNKYGRKYALIGDLTLLLACLLLSSFSTDIVMFTITRFFVMMCTAGSHNICHLFIIENMPPKWRSIIPTYLSYPVGFVSMAIIGHLCGDWKTLTYASAAVTVLPLILMMFAIETPSAIFSQAGMIEGQKKKPTDVKLESQEPDATEALLKKKAKACRKRAREAALKCDTFLFSKKSSDFDEKWKAAATQQRLNEIASKMAAGDAEQAASNSRISPLFKDRRLVCFTLVLSFGIATLSTTTYGVLMALSDIPGEIWVNIIWSAIVSYMCNWIAIGAELICGKINHPLWAGRRQIHIGFALLTLSFIISLLVVDISGYAASGSMFWKWVVRILAWSIIGTCTELYIVFHVQCSETYPTPVRALGCTIVQTSSRLGNSIGAALRLLKGYGSFLPYTIMAALFSSELALYLNYSYGLCGRKTEEQQVIRETKGKPKPEFMASEGKGKNFDEYLEKAKLSDEDLAEFDEI